jgi:hypothetical protein
MSTPDPGIEELLVALKADGKSEPKNWHRFYLFLKARQQPGQKDPLVPLILGASMESSASKHERLADQLYWAQENGCLDDAIRYLKAIPAKRWNLCSPERWNRSSYPDPSETDSESD